MVFLQIFESRFQGRRFYSLFDDSIVRDNFTKILQDWLKKAAHLVKMRDFGFYLSVTNVVTSAFIYYN